MGKGGHMEDLPVDRGWSWVICAACFFCMFLSGVAPQALAILFLELVAEFESSITVTSLSVMFYVMSISVSSLVATSVLVPRFGERKVIVVASIVFSACSVGYSVSPNIGIFIAFSTVQGTSVGMVYVPAVSLLSRYFDKRRSLANTISNCGLCVAAIVSPRLVRLLASEFGMRGAFLVLAAVELHMTASALLLRPVSCYRIVPEETKGPIEMDEIKATTTIKDISHSNDRTEFSEAKQQLLSDSENNELLTKKDSNGTVPKHVAGVRFYDKVDSQVCDIRDESTDDANLSENDEESFCPDGTEQVLTKNNGSESIESQLSAPYHYGSEEWIVDYRKPSMIAHYGSALSLTGETESASVGMSLQKMNDILDEEEEMKRKKKEGGCRSCCFVQILIHMFDPSLFSQWAFRVFLIAAIPGATTQFLLQYLPTIAVVKGADKDQAATLLTIVGSVDLVSRIAMGAFADTKLLRPTQIGAIAQTCLGILCLFNPLFNTFETMIVMAVIMGLFVGTRQCLMALMQIEIVGMERMSRCLSITAMVATISGSSHSPLLSALMEATGSYTAVLYYVGVALIIGAVLIGSTSLVARFVDEKQEIKKMGKDLKSSK